MTDRLSRSAIVVLACVSLLVGGITGAFAGTGKNNSGSGTADAGGDGTTYHVRVTYTERGTGEGDGAKPVRSANVNFVPPVCWYKSFTPEEFKREIDRRYTAAGQSGAGTVYNYYNQIQSQMNDIKYHQGDDGSWWVLTYDDSQLEKPHPPICPYDTGWMWRGPGDPEPPLVISPWVLAQAAYGQMRLPTKGVALSPVAGNQKVNLSTYVSFRRAITPVSVTAGLEGLAATVVAVPQSLHVDAGTSYASPQTCDYTFADSGGGYAVDSAGADCNITYRKATAAGGTYPLMAEITWRVTWTATATPQPGGGQTLPIGYSDFEQPVTVQEIQTVNR